MMNEKNERSLHNVLDRSSTFFRRVISTIEDHRIKTDPSSQRVRLFVIRQHSMRSAAIILFWSSDWKVVNVLKNQYAEFFLAHKSFSQSIYISETALSYSLSEARKSVLSSSGSIHDSHRSDWIER